jgi:uncharacterized membrane protein
MTDSPFDQNTPSKPQPRNTSWRAVGIAILATFLGSIACCAGGAVLSKTKLDTLTGILFGFGSILAILCVLSLPLALVLMLVEFVRGQLRKK